MIRELAPSEDQAAVVLTCCDCGCTFEPSIEDFADGGTGCPEPDCGGWTVWARLVEPAAGPTARQDV